MFFLVRILADIGLEHYNLLRKMYVPIKNLISLSFVHLLQERNIFHTYIKQLCSTINFELCKDTILLNLCWFATVKRFCMNLW
jgi:hypothetical protein